MAYPSYPIITVLGDLLKHVTITYYIKFEDQKMNLLIYPLITIVITYILNIIFDYKSFTEQINYLKWHFTYKILNRTKIIYPCNTEIRHYSPFDEKIDIPDSKTMSYIILVNDGDNKDKQHLLNSLGLRLEKHYSGNSSGFTSPSYYSFKIDESNHQHKKIRVNKKTFGLYFESKGDAFKVIAFINGYYILIDIKNYSDGFANANSNTNIDDEEFYDHITLYCKSREALDVFMNIVSRDVEENKHILLPNEHKLKVVEYDRKNKNTLMIGLVKRALTFENYVSRHKKSLLKSLDAFKNNKLYEGNPYIENNLGLLLYGDPGTGKSFIISAVANYLQRNIYTINFTKIKTKSEFRNIMSLDNIAKNVFSFDEFDILLSTLLDNDRGDKNADIRSQIQALSVQINNCNDKDTKHILIEQMKTLMDNGSSDELTLDFLLSEMSGLSSVTNRVIIATTNFIDKIPIALLRAGRFDIKVHLDKFNEEEIYELLTKLYKPKPNSEEYRIIKNAKLPGNKYTAAKLISMYQSNTKIQDMISVLGK